jgi:hypothetical protein
LWPSPLRPRPRLPGRNSKPSWQTLFRALLQGANHVWDFLPFKLLYTLAVAGALLALPFLGAAPAGGAFAGDHCRSQRSPAPGTCAAPKAPSRAFNLALGHVSAGGEVKTLAAR